MNITIQMQTDDLSQKSVELNELADLIEKEASLKWTPLSKQ